MRLFLLPISTKRILLYCSKTPPSEPSTSYADRLVSKAAATWTSFEKAESGWKKTLTVTGNGILSRIPFEEWGLKSLPVLSKRTADEARGKVVEVEFPGRFLDRERVMASLDRMASERQALHRSRMVWSVVAMPFTIPVGLIPIIPNIPGIYLAFRAWSHYKALFGARYLKHILDLKLVSPSPSLVLDEMYAAGLIHPTREKSRAAEMPTQSETEFMAAKVVEDGNHGSEEVMLLRRWNGKLLAERLNLPELEVEIERAVEQVEKGIKADTEARSKAQGEKVAESVKSDAESSRR